MGRYRFAPDVLEDLKEIARYIARDNPVAARNYESSSQRGSAY
jgi:plasmid stabilization system protein ParE